ncbi:GTPase [Saccharomycopsis crataegensis]|uniref:GPN-loop GTPase n=1 Tax=Saccharomycopsis crataegensis TaxID=43959 RepID=A0AAV5QQF9_9ASCO|nr:GTPase [Saccharomycopsis crataegensis]
MAPANLLVIGMAGSGKTTFMQRLNSHLHAKKNPPYVINLDPAVLKVPYGCNIDIRDSVNYHKVMDHYNLGPNGAIVTSLNLFSTKIDQIVQLLDKRAENYNHVIIDTPGQIECFIWSASGSIITQALASAFPTIIVYLIDTPRTTSPSTFMSNMLYACSILYKTKLPMIIVFNKCDIKDYEFAKEWMTDFEAFQASMSSDQHNSSEGGDSGYMNSLINSMSLMLEEFYSQLDVVGVSSYTGKGFDEFLDIVDDKVKEYNDVYKAEQERILKQREQDEADRKVKNLSKLVKDLGIKDQNASTSRKKEDDYDGVNVLSDFEDDDDEEEEQEEDTINAPQREYTYEDERFEQIKQQAQQAKEDSTLEKITQYINKSN